MKKKSERGCPGRSEQQKDERRVSSFRLPPSSLQRGQVLVELALVIPMFLLIIAEALWFGPQAYARLAGDTISYDCATAASQSLDAAQGVRQGRVAALDTAKGFRIPSANVSIQIVTPPRWDRGQPVVCLVNLHVYGGGLPLVSAFFPTPSRVTSRTTLLIEMYKSRWK